MAELERTIYLLRERERNLRYMAQSLRCSTRPAAELELGRVREEILHRFEEVRLLQPNA